MSDVPEYVKELDEFFRTQAMRQAVQLQQWEKQQAVIDAARAYRDSFEAYCKAQLDYVDPNKPTGRIVIEAAASNANGRQDALFDALKELDDE